MIEFPRFKTGNKSIAKALNTCVQFAKETGVNPANRPGWSWSKDGWVPPPSSLNSGGGILPWDIIPDPDTPDSFKLRYPAVVASRVTVTSSTTITNTPFVPTAGEWLVARITSISSPAITIVMEDTWTSYPNAFEFGAGPGYAFVAANIPLYRFYAEQDVGVTLDPIGGVFAKRFISPYPSLYFRLHPVPATDFVRMCPDLR